MALHILNFSVDPPDASPDGVPEDLSYNEMESVLEIVLEEVADIENAIPEQEDADNQGVTKFSAKSIVLYCEAQAQLEVKGAVAASSQIHLPVSGYYASAYQSPVRTQVSPPPEV